MDEQKDEDKNKQKQKQKQKEGDSKMIDECKEKEKSDQFKSHQFESLKFNSKGCQIVVKVPLNLKKFLMTKVVEKMLKTAIIRQIPGIQSAIVLENRGTFYIQTEGVNFGVLKDLDFIKY